MGSVLKNVFNLIVMFSALVWFMLAVTKVSAQDYVLPLWNESIPNQLPTNAVEKQIKTNKLRISNVTNPEILVYLPKFTNKKAKAVLIIPGGGYYHLVEETGDQHTANWLNDNGIVAIQLRYRLPHSEWLIDGHKAPLQDAQRAMRLIRAHADNWNIDVNNVGVMGYSAGGHLAAMLSNKWDDMVYETRDKIDSLSAKPNFTALIFPVISMSSDITHIDSKRNLIGENPSQNILEYYSAEHNVTANTPTTFIAHGTQDKVVSVENSLRYYQALLTAHVPAEMHLYAKGGHGFVLKNENDYKITWRAQFINWLSINN